MSNTHQSDNDNDDVLTKEQVAQLAEVNIIKLKTGAVEGLIGQMVEARREMEQQELLIEELKREAALLEAEEELHRAQLHSIEKDKEHLSVALSAALGQKESLQHKMSVKYSQQYNELRDSVDQLREKHGLARLPTLHEVEEESAKSYLERRRHKWRSTGVSVAVESSKR